MILMALSVLAAAVGAVDDPIDVAVPLSASEAQRELAALESAPQDGARLALVFLGAVTYENVYESVDILALAAVIRGKRESEGSVRPRASVSSFAHLAGGTTITDNRVISDER